MCCSFIRPLVLVANKLMSFEPAVPSSPSKQDASYAQSHARIGRGRGHERNTCIFQLHRTFISYVRLAHSLEREKESRRKLGVGGIRRGTAVGGWGAAEEPSRFLFNVVMLLRAAERHLSRLL